MTMGERIFQVQRDVANLKRFHRNHYIKVALVNFGLGVIVGFAIARLFT